VTMTSNGSPDQAREGQGPSELREYLIGLWLRKWSILLIGILVVVGALWYSSRRPPVYVSTAEDLVQPANLSPTEPLSAQAYVDILTEQRVASSGQVADLAQQRLEELGLEMGGISVEPSGETTRTLIFTASSTKPKVARETAQAFAEAYLQYRREQVLEDLRAAREPLIQRRAELERLLAGIEEKIARTDDESDRASLQVRINSLFSQRSLLDQKLNELTLPENLHVGDVLQPAGYPGAPSSSRIKTGALSLFVGLSLGGVVALIRDRRDRRLRGKRDLEIRAGAPVLASIRSIPPPIDESSGSTTVTPTNTTLALDEPWISAVVMMSDRASQAAAGYRELSASLLAAASRRGAKSILVTSCEDRYAKSVTAVNLSVTLAEAGKRVVLICADQNDENGGTPTPSSKGDGFTDLVDGHAGVQDTLSHSQFVENLQIIGRRRSTNGHTLLQEEAVREILSRIVGVADYVVIDAGRILKSADTRILASAVDGALLVVDGERADRGAIAEARRQFDLIGCGLIGTVLHSANEKRLSYYDDDGGFFGRS
jgi:polysaccharide biosynthesis transport protein